MKQLCQNKHTIRFRYWNRKKYAIFYSLGKCVTIGNLKKEIADVSLGKQANVCTAFSVCSSARKEDAGEEYEEGMPPVESMLQMLRIQLPQPQVADGIAINTFKFEEYPPKKSEMYLEYTDVDGEKNGAYQTKKIRIQDLGKEGKVTLLKEEKKEEE